jgi:ADP-ribose pyrophosphatase YjhB (NUDIX family)
MINNESLREHCLVTLPGQLSQYNPYNVQRYCGDSYTVPDGPWNVGSRGPLPADMRRQLDGYECDFDDLGRPIHPWYKGLLESCGVVSGTGRYYNWGPNYTSDPVVITDELDPHILLVQRADNGCWAFPGGFVDPGESAEMAGLRETREETGVSIEVDPIRIVYKGVVADERTTAHAWADTMAILWRPRNRQETYISEESKSVSWFPVDNLPDRLHGSHQKIIESALEGLT